MSRFLRACDREKVDCTPVWFMRQAGRYMEEYRKLRERHSLLELCHNPELAAEVTLQPIRRFDVDAAIIFADILLPLPVMGVDFHFAAGEGPRIENPIHSTADVDRVHVGEPETELAFVAETIRLVRAALRPEVALIGFAGAPFTLASYMIEGGHSRHFLKTKALMHESPTHWHRLLATVTEVTIRYLSSQVHAGAQAIQLFDSWVGALSGEDYEEYVLPHSKRIFDTLSPLGVPTIHFGTGTAGFLGLMKQAGGSVQSVDWRVRLDEAWKQLGPDVAIQGNLDPADMLAPWEVLERKVTAILARAAGRPGHIFNLGHGFFPVTPVSNVERVVELVHRYSCVRDQLREAPIARP